MGRYVVVLKGPPDTWEEAEKCGPIWNRALSEFTDITALRDFGSISEGRYVGIFEAPGADRIRELFNAFDDRVRESGLFPNLTKSWEELDIWAVDFESEGANIVYKAELAKV